MSLRQNTQTVWFNLVSERMCMNGTLFLYAKCHHLKVTLICVYVVNLLVARGCVYLTQAAPSFNVCVFKDCFVGWFYFIEVKDGTQKVEAKTPSQEEDDGKPGHPVYLPLL